MKWNSCYPRSLFCSFGKTIFLTMAFVNTHARARYMYTNLCRNSSFRHNEWNIQYSFHKCDMYVVCVCDHLNEQVISWFLIYFIQYLYRSTSVCSRKIWNCNFEWIWRWAGFWPQNIIMHAHIGTRATYVRIQFIGGTWNVKECLYLM